jgi:hypothetical protein
MTLTSSGYNCDVCGNYILGLFDKDKVYPVKIKGITQIIDCCHKCIELIKNSDGDWKKLPEGRLRKAFEEANNLKEKNNEQG